MLSLNELPDHLDGPKTTDGLPKGPNGLALQFKDDKGLPLSGGEVIEAMRIAAIATKPPCGSERPGEAEVIQADALLVLDGEMPERDFELKPRRVADPNDFELKVRRRPDPEDFDINPRRIN